jgi:hypothetical protein
MVRLIFFTAVIHRLHCLKKNPHNGAHLFITFYIKPLAHNKIIFGSVIQKVLSQT